MGEVRPLREPITDEAIRQVAITHLIGAVNYGSVTIRYQNGQPWQVERLEITRLGKEEERAT